MLSALILSCIIAGSLACSDDQCKDRELADDLLEIKFLPNKQQLRTLCPKVKTFLECERDFFVCQEGSLDELVSSSDKRVANNAKAMLSGMSLIEDLCDEDSSFHNDYVASVDCFRGFIPVASRLCRRDIVTPIEQFFEDLYPTGREMSEQAYAEMSCLSDALELACLIDNLGDSCGSVARRTAMTALEKMAVLVKAGSCEDVENAADLKTKLLNFLELEDERRDKMQGIFDLLKRRR